MSSIPPLLDSLVRQQDVTQEALQHAIGQILRGEEQDIMIAALLVALASKGETANDIAAAVGALRQEMTPLPDNMPIDRAIDIVGTGGDQQHSYNISTTTALVVASCGVPVAKHGNRAASSLSGASDVLGALGVAIDCSTALVQQALHEINIAFLWAPLYHPGMRFAAPVRSALKIKTLFNYVGPLCNPARVKRYLLGCSNAEKLPLMVAVLQKQGSSRVWGVHGDQGLDELSITGANHVIALENGTMREFSVHPHDAGLDVHPMSTLRGGTAQDNASALTRLLQSEKDQVLCGYRDTVLLNAAAALMVAEAVNQLADGVAMAAEAIDTGAAYHTLQRLITLSNQSAS